MIYFIVNPLSGKGKARKYLSFIEKFLKELNITYQFFITEYKGHAFQIAQELRGKPEVSFIIIIGGDGTLHEVVNGLYPSDIPLGYIPAGYDKVVELANRSRWKQKFPSLLKRRMQQIISLLHSPYCNHIILNFDE
ncbi:diacylglycerol/lipid kinase family protein [Tepidibacillus fermentans]|uniref:Diacylglycerol kinase-like protein n=1 Tax=Tepidibacillus fermentans TaxID=1281767 RepID=A0A4R3KCZ8_9BACI|nr:acylglycerol kinase family protein [Tepidibacillus fermentans]TCS80809.1 diacylglycerol kinase-like protein [Tepidibacillus fermentans]